MHATTDATGARADECRIAWIATTQDDFIAAKQGSHRTGVKHNTALQIHRAVERQSARHAGDRIEVNIA